MDQILDNWTWDNMQTILNSDDYNWGLTHGDFHAGQVLAGNDDHSDLVLLDWGFSGFSNPGIDMATWFIVYPFNDFVKENEEHFLYTYWTALGSEGVDLLDYSFEQLKYDYLNYGTAHAMVRMCGFAGIAAYAGKMKIAQGILDGMAIWLNEHDLTSEDMSVPMYGWF